MVEATQQHEEDQDTVQKNFTEDPAILDKFKAASVITDGTFFLLLLLNAF